MRIDLLPPEFRSSRSPSSSRPMLMWVIILLTGGALLGMVYQFYQYQNERNRLDRLTIQLASMRISAAEIEKVKVERQEVVKRSMENAKLDAAYLPSLDLLTEISNSLTDATWLVEIDCPASGQWMMKGKSRYFTSVGDFLRKLNQSPHFKNVRLAEVHQVTKGTACYKFTIYLTTAGRGVQYGK